MPAGQNRLDLALESLSLGLTELASSRAAPFHHDTAGMAATLHYNMACVILRKQPVDALGE